MKEIKTIKVCSFYADEWHLTTMLLPQINTLINKNEKIQTIFENGIKDNIEKLLSKMNLKSETVKQILEIDYNSKIKCKYTEIKEQIEKLTNEEKTINIIISGSNKYIKMANEIIEKIAKTLKEKEITIINCYRISENEEIESILDKYKYTLNTSGIKNIEEVYKKKAN